MHTQSTMHALNLKNEFYLPVVLICQVEKIFHLSNHCQPLNERSIFVLRKNSLSGSSIFLRYHEDKVSSDLSNFFYKNPFLDLFLRIRVLLQVFYSVKTSKATKDNPLYQIMTSFQHEFFIFVCYI